MLIKCTFQIWEPPSFRVVRNCGIIRWRTRRRLNCRGRRSSTPPSSIRRCTRRSPYVPIFDYLQTKLWTLSCNKQAPQSITTLVLFFFFTIQADSCKHESTITTPRPRALQKFKFSHCSSTSGGYSPQP